MTPERPEPDEGAEFRADQAVERFLAATQQDLEDIIALARAVTRGGGVMSDGATTKTFPFGGTASLEITTFPEDSPEGETLAVINHIQQPSTPLDEGFHIWQEGEELIAEKLVPAGEPTLGLSPEGKLREAMAAVQFEKDVGLTFFSRWDAKEAIKQLEALRDGLDYENDA
ncbi:MAG TPA: hypothetical protein VK963_00225 [Candidatus Saccharimonadales bacterium]|nr:hypothetical protein [Candidatus Saccharimonadales bacterium]